MKKEKNGFTTIELLVCFVIISSITISLFGVILNYKNKQQIVGIKGEVHRYISTITKMIEDDLIHLKLTSVTISNKSATLQFQDGSSKILNVVENNPSDVVIQYGDATNLINYPIPYVESLTVVNSYLTRSEVYGYPFFEFYLELNHPDIEHNEKIDINYPI